MANPVTPAARARALKQNTAAAQKVSRRVSHFIAVESVRGRPPKGPLPLDLINHPPHYTAHPSGVECITITEHMTFCVGNAIKYLWRADQKGGLEDLKKAAWYVAREIARMEAGPG
jgi:hypothetical protein